MSKPRSPTRDHSDSKQAPITGTDARPSVECTEVSIEAALALAERSKREALGEKGGELLIAIIRSLDGLQRLLADKDVTLAEMRAHVFGSRDERYSSIFSAPPGDSANGALAATGTDTAPEADNGVALTGDGSTSIGIGDASAQEKAPKRPRPGHGRRSADEYTGATKVHVEHDSLKVGCACPECITGRLYNYVPKKFIRLTGGKPIEAYCTIVEQLRCGSCGFIVSAPIQAEVSNAMKKTADNSAVVMIGHSRYIYGIPFYRLADLQAILGVPLTWTMQWDLVDAGANVLRFVFDALVEMAAQGHLVHADDTRQLVLDAVREARRAAEEDKRACGKKKSKLRTGSFTTGMVVRVEDQQIMLFFTGPQHAGDNLEDLLKQRSADLAAPILMSDGLSWNTCGDFEVIDTRCNAHARRKFVAQIPNFPEECKTVLDTFRTIYKNDDLAKSRKLSSEERQRFHQAESKPALDSLKEWMEEQVTSKQVEPNSGLGKAIAYMIALWVQLTRFLDVPGVPLDNNITERALKLSIRHRRNSLFYKTERGAEVGDIFMTLIHTARAANVNSIDYLEVLLDNAASVEADPRAWLPWNYTMAIAAATAMRAERPVANLLAVA
jgi:hypothetical protein